MINLSPILTYFRNSAIGTLTLFKFVAIGFIALLSSPVLIPIALICLPGWITYQITEAQ